METKEEHIQVEDDNTVPGRMLVVDDDAMYRTLLRISLEEKGYQIDESENGKQGLAKLRSAAYDLVFLDLLMPEMNGFETLERIKSDDRTAHIPVIVISGEDDIDSLVRCIETGAADYLNKPFDPVVLHARVNASLATKRLHDREQAYFKTIQSQKEIAESANRKIMESINYAKRIQLSLLANPDEVKTYLPHSLFFWEPRDVVGGDIYYTIAIGHNIFIAVIDCTGHGVPGAFMTMIAISALKRIIQDESRHDPAGILQRLNFLVKTTLQQDKEHTTSDDGMDVGIVRVTNPSQSPELTFAGARIPLFYTIGNEIHTIKSDRQSIGYKRSDVNFRFTNHSIPVKKGMRFYMATDGFTDQLGGKNYRKFGNARFKNLLEEISKMVFEKQKKILLRSFEEFAGKNEQQDDITVVGFGI